MSQMNILLNSIFFFSYKIHTHIHKKINKYKKKKKSKSKNNKKIKNIILNLTPILIIKSKLQCGRALRPF